MNIHTSLHAHGYLSPNECFTMWHTQIRQGSQANTPQFSSFSLCPEIVPNLSKRPVSKRTLLHKDAKFNLSHLPALILLTSLFSRMLIIIDDFKSNNKINRYGDKGSPWCTPLLTSKVSEKPSFI